MTDWITVPDSLINEALGLIRQNYLAMLEMARLGLIRQNYLTDRTPDDTSDYPVELLDGLIAYLSEAGDCDHSVNICACAEQDAVRELRLAKEGKLLCRNCGGDGIIWSEEAAEKFRREHPDYDDAFAGNVDCPDCSRGIARIKPDGAG